jgi:hypothetical protein
MTPRQTLDSIAARVPTVEGRLLDMKLQSAMLARLLGAMAVENDSAHGTEGSDAFYGFERVAQALYKDICAVSHALHESASKPVMLEAPDVDEDGGDQ